MTVATTEQRNHMRGMIAACAAEPSASVTAEQYEEALRVLWQQQDSQRIRIAGLLEAAVTNGERERLKWELTVAEAAIVSYRWRLQELGSVAQSPS